jgi:hypothetical protein
VSRASRHRFNVTIASGATASSEFQVDSGALVGIMMPAAWTAGNLAVQVLTARTGNPPTDTWATVVDTTGTDFVVTSPAAGEYMVINVGALNGLGTCRLVSSVSQGAARTVGVIVVTSD